MTKIGVVGAGVMGVGVAQSLSAAGEDVVLVDVSENVLDTARAELERATRTARLLRPPSAAGRSTSSSRTSPKTGT
jgi:3-hydroxybutyryl-CoA dehydrogenase